MRKNTLYNLDAISKYSIYSKLNINFDRILGDRSLKGFVKINKRPKFIKKSNYLEEIHQKYPNEMKEIDKKDPNEFINQLILKKNESNKNDSINTNNYYKIFKSQPNNKAQKISIKNYFNTKKNKYQEIISLDPFKYNPNYNAIFKKIPYVRIVEPKVHKIKKYNRDNKDNKDNSDNNDSNDNSLSNKQNKKHRYKSVGSYGVPSINISNESDNNINESNSIDSKNNINSIKLPKVNINKPSFRNENHALRFSKYGNQRKYNTENRNEYDGNVMQKNNNNNNNNSLSVDKINTKKIFAVNFDKMMSRKGTDFLNSYSLKTPSFNRYYPNYDFVKNSPAKISFSYHKIDNNDKKKYLLRKLMSSYNVDTEFHIINNNKINQNISSNSIDK